MPSLQRTLVVCQALGAVVAIAAHCYEDESVLVTGSIFSVTGLVIAGAAFRDNRPHGFFYGMTVPTIAVLAAATIAFLGWGPGESFVPLLCVLIPLAIVIVGRCRVVLRELARERDGGAPPLRLQFGVGAIMLVTVLVALPFAAHRAFSVDRPRRPLLAEAPAYVPPPADNYRARQAVAVVGLFAYVILFLLVTHDFTRQRTERVRQARLGDAAASEARPADSAEISP